MHADEVEVVGGAGFDCLVEKTGADARADFDARVDLLGRVISRHHDVGVVLDLVRPLPAFVKAAVKFVPDLPVLDVLLIAADGDAHVISPYCMSLIGPLRVPPSARPRGEVTPDA